MCNSFFSVFALYYRRRRENSEIATIVCSVFHYITAGGEKILKLQFLFYCFYTINYQRSRENLEIVTRFLMVLHYITAGGEKSFKLQLGFLCFFTILPPEAKKF